LPFIFEADAGVTSDDKATPDIASDIMTAIALMAISRFCSTARATCRCSPAWRNDDFQSRIAANQPDHRGLDGRPPRDQLHVMLGRKAALELADRSRFHCCCCRTCTARTATVLEARGRDKGEK
jgi:hypothetical protein